MALLQHTIRLAGLSLRTHIMAPRSVALPIFVHSLQVRGGWCGAARGCERARVCVRQKGGKRIFARTHPHARTRAHSRLLQMRGESVAFMSTKRRRQGATKDSGAPPATPSVVKAATTAPVPDAGASIASQFHEDPADLRPTNLRNMVNPFISARPGRLT
ncbi:hypothetical protein EON67_10230, partial [archaeon]